jgi:hypothetical protein
MSEQLFEVSGISLDGRVNILYGDPAPGGTTQTDYAQVGSVYYCTDGKTWKKILAGTGTDKWELDSSSSSTLDSGILSVKGLPAFASRVLDSIIGTEAETAVWAVTIINTVGPANRATFLITGSHNGVAAQHTIYSRMMFGNKIPQIDYTVRLLNGYLELVVSAGIPYDVECYRMTAVSKGGIQIVGGGGGTGDVTSTQLNAEVAARESADTNLQTALTTGLSTKADITAVATQFATVATQVAALNTAVASLSTPTSNTISFVEADLVGNTLVVTHNLGQKYVNVQVYDNNDFMVLADDIQLTSDTQCTVFLPSFMPLVGTWYVKVTK